MYLTIDIGNTRTKAAVFDADGLLVLSTVVEGDELAFLNSLIHSHRIRHVITSSTGSRAWEAASLDVPGKNIRLSHETLLPIQLIYTTPETLGRDRIAAACGAHAAFPNSTCLVIDAGTCITMDMVTDTGLFLGGNIAPGLRMRLKAMHDYTARLPLVDPDWPDLPFGDSTMHAMQNGACLGAKMEIEGIYRKAKDAFGTVSIVMTGGDAAFLADKVESEIFVEPELVVKGLFKILSFNVQ